MNTFCEIKRDLRAQVSTGYQVREAVSRFDGNRDGTMSLYEMRKVPHLEAWDFVGWLWGCRVHGARCTVQGAECRVQGAGCRVQVAGCRA